MHSKQTDNRRGMKLAVVTVMAATVVLGSRVAAQRNRASPAGSSATQVGGKYVPGGEQPRYEGGK